MTRPMRSCDYRLSWLALAVVLSPCGMGAEKQREWQTGVVVESGVEQVTKAWGSLLNQRTALVNRTVYVVQTQKKSYAVTGLIRAGNHTPIVGSTVRLAIEGRTMFVVVGGRESRLGVLQVRARSDAPQVPALGVTTTPAVANEPALNAAALDNDAVVKMIVGGLKEETVLQVIEARPGRFLLAPDAVLALKAAGVPQSVIDAMTKKMATPR